MSELKWEGDPPPVQVEDDKPKDERRMCVAASLSSSGPPKGCKVYLDEPYPHWVTLKKDGKLKRWPSTRCQPCAQAALNAGKWWMKDRWWDVAEPVK